MPSNSNWFNTLGGQNVERTATRFELVVDMTPGELGYYGYHVMHKGDIVYKFAGNHYGCQPLPNGIMVSIGDPLNYPFFEIPKSALKVMPDDVEPGNGD